MKDRGGRSGRTAGFTLIELLSVIVVILFLAGLSLGLTRYAANRASRAQALTRFEAIRNALDEHRLHYGDYPNIVDQLPSTNVVSTNLCYHLWNKPQAASLPPFLKLKGWTDPNQRYTIMDPWNNPFQYEYLGRFRYKLWSTGPDSTHAGDDVTTETGNL